MVLAFCGAGIALAQEQQNYPPQFPRANATEVLSNDRVNVWDAYWPKNQPTQCTGTSLT